MAIDGVKFTQTVTALHSLNASHPLAPVDRIKTFTAALQNPIAGGVLLKLNGTDYEPWIQGTDAANLIVGIYAGPAQIDTNTDEQGLVRVFGPVAADKLTAWTIADGSASAPAEAAALAQLESVYIFPL